MCGSVPAWAEQCDLACSQAGNLKSHYQNVHGKKFKKTSSCKEGGGESFWVEGSERLRG